MHGQLKSSQSGIKIKLIHQYLFALAKKYGADFQNYSHIHFVERQQLRMLIINLKHCPYVMMPRGHNKKRPNNSITS